MSAVPARDRPGFRARGPWRGLLAPGCGDKSLPLWGQCGSMNAAGSRRAWVWPLLLILLGLAALATRNLPWHLDDKDQAKQAYIAVEMLRDGGPSWWFQHTPDRDVATKPPLMGWINAGLRTVGLPWDWAWRLPGIVAGLWMVWALIRRGQGLAEGAVAVGRGRPGASAASASSVALASSVGVGGKGSSAALSWIALCPALFFVANLLTPRVITLVRTDALLAGAVGWAALAIYDCLRESGAVDRVNRLDGKSGRIGPDASVAVCLALTVAALLKGPIAWVFLVPGALIWSLLRRIRPAWNLPRLPVRWWAWLLPLLPFVAWSLAAMRWQPGFYEQVVLREFLGRFEGGENATHNVQNPLYYLLQLAKCFAPWVLAAGVLTVLDRGVWARLRRQPGVLWMLLAAVGALVVMSAIPSKRLDRVFPLMVPAAVVAGGFAAACQLPRKGLWLAGVSVVAALGYAGYTASEVAARFRRDEAAFTRTLRQDLPQWLAAAGVDLGAGEVASLERNAEALFVWQPQIRLLGSRQLENAVRQDGVRAVLLRARDRDKLRAVSPRARLLHSLPAPAESNKPLELWLLPRVGEDAQPAGQSRFVPDLPVDHQAERAIR